MMLSRATLMSVSGCPVTGSLVFRGSIGPAVTLRLHLPLDGMTLVQSGSICVLGCRLWCRRCGSYTSLDWPPVWAEVVAVDQCPCSPTLVRIRLR